MTHFIIPKYRTNHPYKNVVIAKRSDNSSGKAYAALGWLDRRRNSKSGVLDIFGNNIVTNTNDSELYILML